MGQAGQRFKRYRQERQQTGGNKKPQAEAWGENADFR
jgi:hypothetical protein